MPSSVRRPNKLFNACGVHGVLYVATFFECGADDYAVSDLQSLSEGLCGNTTSDPQ